jgi:hypothetical protein
MCVTIPRIPSISGNVLFPQRKRKLVRSTSRIMGELFASSDKLFGIDTKILTYCFKVWIILYAKIHGTILRIPSIYGNVLFVQRRQKRVRVTSETMEGLCALAAELSGVVPIRTHALLCSSAKPVATV